MTRGNQRHAAAPRALVRKPRRDRRRAPEGRGGRADRRARSESIDEETLRGYLYDPETPDPDLLIRTAGEMRISNFLLWQISYSELFVSPVCWPEFRKPHLMEALTAYAGRKRKFGGLISDGPPKRRR
jgi:hypothetical protein